MGPVSSWLETRRGLDRHRSGLVLALARADRCGLTLPFAAQVTTRRESGSTPPPCRAPRTCPCPGSKAAPPSL